MKSRGLLKKSPTPPAFFLPSPRILAFILALAAGIPASAGKIVIRGSDTLGAKLVPMLAEQYRAAKPGVTFEIAAEGSTTGIAAIIDGTAQIGMSSRSAKSTEMSAASAKGVDMRATIVAYDGIGIIVNAGNPLAGLTRRQIEQIFTGDITDWSAVGGKPGKISIYTRNTSSGTYADFKQLAMRKRDYARSSQKMAGNEQIAAEVARNPNGIGYVGLAYLGSPGIKALSADGALPTKQAVLDKKYPLARPTFYYTNGQPSGEAAAFVAFTLGEEGQRIAEKIGFVPVR
ncbi:phosphate transport system substrate-binding protein [Ereboglobus sp. PH5-10]|uniref:phosphate ABC transporter substrate-binding protein n=1 Tax=Ereboglobus sp. PH5-10 TaxID=2940629 RepID=UPI002406FDF0|nr:phosphate ABC transporter substrate-binding protein [Ereboglobus sp. PH5-10]MDF9826835.1 phosphate transport system substrate-binding protein [Ereboglobus sp. PH5-10]